MINPVNNCITSVQQFTHDHSKVIKKVAAVALGVLGSAAACAIFSPPASYFLMLGISYATLSYILDGRDLVLIREEGDENRTVYVKPRRSFFTERVYIPVKRTVTRRPRFEQEHREHVDGPTPENRRPVGSRAEKKTDETNHRIVGNRESKQ